MVLPVAVPAVVAAPDGWKREGDEPEDDPIEAVGWPPPEPENIDPISAWEDVTS
jgi:hypothetical protein